MISLRLLALSLVLIFALYQGVESQADFVCPPGRPKFLCAHAKREQEARDRNRAQLRTRTNNNNPSGRLHSRRILSRQKAVIDKSNDPPKPKPTSRNTAIKRPVAPRRPQPAARINRPVPPKPAVSIRSKKCPKNWPKFLCQYVKTAVEDPEAAQALRPEVSEEGSKTTTRKPVTRFLITRKPPTRAGSKSPSAARISSTGRARVTTLSSKGRQRGSSTKTISRGSTRIAPNVAGRKTSKTRLPRPHTGRRVTAKSGGSGGIRASTTPRPHSVNLTLEEAELALLSNETELVDLNVTRGLISNITLGLNETNANETAVIEKSSEEAEPVWKDEELHGIEDVSLESKEFEDRAIKEVKEEKPSKILEKTAEAETKIEEKEDKTRIKLPPKQEELVKSAVVSIVEQNFTSAEGNATSEEEQRFAEAQPVESRELEIKESESEEVINGTRPAIPAWCRIKLLPCDEGCTLTYDKDNCPHNCNCGRLPRCPKVTCPLPYPRCLIITQHDGCQTCGCRDPIVVLNGDNGAEEVVLVSLKPVNATEIEEENEAAGDDAVAQIFKQKSSKTPEKLIADAIIHSKKNENGSTVIDINGQAFSVQTYPIAKREREAADGPECTKEMRKEIDNTFKQVFKFLRIQRIPTPPERRLFPVTYSYDHRSVDHACKVYQEINQKKANQTLLDICESKYTRFNELKAYMEYPCAAESKEEFGKHYECIRGSQHNITATKCLQQAKTRLLDPFVDSCDVYNIFADCLYDPVLYRCGLEAWDVTLKYLSLNIQQQLPSCTLDKIKRSVDLAAV